MATRLRNGRNIISFSVHIVGAHTYHHRQLICLTQRLEISLDRACIIAMRLLVVLPGQVRRFSLKAGLLRATFINRVFTTLILIHFLH